ncbi:hypothetical protein [Kocuria atrinae]|uniref:hypothetical protein n=1 Tax=Kocuria atrinae TaxID=592377 RepID=UPI002942331E|nr:hypothetical protein [Kocuria atrinae]
MARATTAPPRAYEDVLFRESTPSHRQQRTEEVFIVSTMIDQRQKAGAREWGALAVLMLPVLLVSVNNTALSFALPAISKALHPTASQLLWIVDIYPLILAALLIPMAAWVTESGVARSS